MAFLEYSNVGITAMAACVPKKVLYNKDLDHLMAKETIDKMISTIGIKEKRYAHKSVTSSDLCFKAADQLLIDNDIDRESIDMVIFLSMTPDYIMPPTSSLLQHRLQLPEDTACLDLSMACSGFVYSLSTAFAYASIPGVDRVLLLVGETMSKLVSPLDRVNFPLYGDAGTACLIEKGSFGKSYFKLAAGGYGEKEVLVPHGGFRNMITAESLEMKEREEGNSRRDCDITMDGMSTFNHAIKAIPQEIKSLLSMSHMDKDQIDYLVSHQANKFMIDFIIKRMKFDPGKVPFCISKYGNTSAASIPLTIVSELQNEMKCENKMLISAIGAGWSLGNAVLSNKQISISNVTEYEI